MHLITIMDQDESNIHLSPPSLDSPAVAALKGQAVEKGPSRANMERTISMDIREEREDLKQAAEQALNVILDLGLNGVVRWVSPTWQDVVGTTPDSVQGKPIADILLDNKAAFDEAVESMKQDDSRSQIVKFSVLMGSSSKLKRERNSGAFDAEGDKSEVEDAGSQQSTLNLEGQGIMVYDRSSGGESHVSIVSPQGTCTR